MTDEKQIKDDVSFEDAEDYKSSSENLTIKQIILKQLEKTTEAGSQEMHEGGVVNRIINGQVIQMPVPNTKEIFKNRVSMLWLLVYPKYLELRKTFDGEITEINKKEENIIDDYKKRYNNFMGYWDKVRQGPKNEWMNINVVAELKNIQDQSESQIMLLQHDKLKVISKLLNEVNYFEDVGLKM